MQKINTERAYAPRSRHPRRLALTALAAVMALALSGTAFAANTFGIRDLIGQVFGWTVNEAAEVLELELDADYPTAGGGTFGENGEFSYAYTMKSATLSATGITYAYAYTYDLAGGELPGAPLPRLQLKLKDGALVDATVTDYTDEDGVVTANAVFSEPISLAEAHYVILWNPDFGQVAGGGIDAGIMIPVTEPVFSGDDSDVTVSDSAVTDYGELEILPPAEFSPAE
jgi:hypothetical protein